MLLFSAASAWSTVTAAATVFDPGNASFHATFGEKTVGLRILAFSVMPGETVPITIPADHRGSGEITVTATGGTLKAIGDWQWAWTAPDGPGTWSLHLARNGETGMTLNVFVLVPASRIRQGHIEGYRIGKYPETPLAGREIYEAPQGFIRVTRDNVDMPVSPHFTLREFLCKQQPGHWPKFLLLRTELLVKLELVLAEVNRRGIATDHLVVMSGYRTPWYNRSIGNGLYSRHVWGGAADIFIDMTGDGRMDDLNNDGHIDMRDALVLHDIVADLFELPRHSRLIGGLGLYGSRPHRGPFVHVDARGNHARWSLP